MTEKTVAIVWMGYNRIISIMGVFDDKATAEKYLLDHGCKLDEGSYERFDGEMVNYRRICVTQEFYDEMQKKLDGKFYLYSVGGEPIKERWSIQITEIPINKIVFGYSDD